MIGNATIEGIKRSARQSMADHAEQIAADGPIADALAAEATARANADTALDQRVDTVETTVASLPGEVAERGDRVDDVEALALSGVKPAKQSVRLLVTTATDPATMTSGSTLDGLTLAANDRVARATPSGAAADGVYVVQASGAAIRSTDMDTEADLIGARFDVDAGTHAAETWAVSTAAPITVGTTVLTLIKTSSANATTAEVQAARGTSPNLGARLDLLDSSSGVASTLAQIEGLSIATAKITEGSGSVTPYVYRTYAFANATTYEIVVTAKAAERGALQIFSNGAGSGWTVNFDLNDATFAGSGANFVSAGMTAIGAGWYECKVVVLTSAAISSQLQVRISPDSVFPYTGDGASGMYVRSIVLQLPNTTTNLLPSSDPNNANFTKSGSTAPLTTTPRVPVLPPLQTLTDSIDILVNGRLIADKIIEPNVSASPSVYHSVSIASGDTFVFDVVAKAGERTRLNLFGQTPAAFDCTFDLVNGTAVGSGAALGSVSITKLGNGWYRCRVTGTATGAGTTTNFQHRIYPAAGGQPYVGDGASGLYLYSSSIKKNGGANLFAFSTDYSKAYWTKSTGVTVSANSGRYLGLLYDPTSLGSNYDDGSAALVGKKWTALGSSITIGAYYAATLASQTGMVLTNLGVSGSCLGLSTTGYASYGMSAPIATMPTDAEIVTLEPGPNAFGAQETPLGAFGDTTYATHYGSIWKAILDIRTRAPSAKIIVFGTYSGGPGHATHRLGRTNGQGNTMDQFMKAEREVCQALGVRYIDISQSGIGYMTSTLYMSDELHPNAAGFLRYATYVAGSLRDMVRRGLFVN
ncbi:SGNH/GDSL hydrolase family protein [Mesorhizobium sp. M1312]|uniref:SGNH/GDSL hydrolase family protein n=1 Tax=unclassified Mesorhizobium TaxID=325217 RepID=UPI003339E81E